MFKKTIFIGYIAFLVLFFPAMTQAAQYYLQYPGCGFMPQDENVNYYRNNLMNYFQYHGLAYDYFSCPVTFNVPDGSAHFIKSIGIRYLDKLTDGRLIIRLKRINLYTGNAHTVALWEGSVEGASPSVQTASKGTEPGVKLVDTKKFAYWLCVYFYRGGALSPGTDLTLYQIRIHYGT